MLKGGDGAIRVRRAVPRDAEVIARMSADANREEGSPTALEAEHVKAHGFGPAALFDVHVLEDRGALIGHAITTKGYDVRFACPTMVLAELYVIPDRRRHGLARLLISAVARRAREIGCRRVQITTGLENEVAHRFYAAIGAKESSQATFLLAGDAIEWLAAEGA